MAEDDPFRPAGSIILRGGGRRLRQRLAVVPRHPLRGAGRQFLGVPLQLGQVVERVGPFNWQVWIRLMNRSPTSGAVQGLVEQGVLAVQDGLLQGPLAR